MNISHAHVICMNDGVEHVVIGTEDQAKAKMSELKAAYWARCHWNFNNDASKYETQCYWHIHTVAAEILP